MPNPDTYKLWYYKEFMITYQVWPINGGALGYKGRAQKEACFPHTQKTILALPTQARSQCLCPFVDFVETLVLCQPQQLAILSLVRKLPSWLLFVFRPLL